MDIDLQYIEQLASNNREGVDVEFKQTTGQLNRGMETLCGMMNGNGGFVVFGVHDSGKIIGQDVSDKTTRDIGEALRKFDPSVDIQPICIDLPDSNKSLIAFKSSGIESDKPYMWDGKPYQRHDSVTSVMPREKFIRLYERQHGLKYRWGNEANSNLTLDMLDENLIRRVVDIGVRKGRLSNSAIGDSIPNILRRLELIKDGELCNAAAVLFGKNLSDYSQCMIRMARFKGNDKRYFIDNQRAEGNIFELIDAAMSFFFKHLMLSGTTHHRIQREEELEIPYDALREAISNALCHRAWQFESSTIGIAIYDDRIVIENAGHFPPSLSPSKIASEETVDDVNVSLPPNETIAKVMFIGGLIENWGRGLAMMDNLCEGVGLPAPTIRDNGSFVFLSFSRHQFQSSIDNGRQSIQNDQATNEENSSKDTSKDTSRTPVEHQTETIDIKLINLINVIGEDWLMSFEIREILGFKSKSTFIKNYLTPAIKLGLLRLENQDSPNAPNQRYGLTVKGKAIYYSQKRHK